MNPETTDAKSLPKSAFPGSPCPPGSLAKRNHPKAFWHGWRVFLDVPDIFSVFARPWLRVSRANPTKMTRLPAKALSREKRGDQHCVIVKIEPSNFRRSFNSLHWQECYADRSRTCVDLRNVRDRDREHGWVDASDLTRGRFERNKPEMLQYLRKFIPAFLDKIFSELGEKTLSVI